MSLGKTIKRIRKERRLTQLHVAEGICDRSYLSLVESDKITPPTEKIQEFAERLNIPITRLIPNHKYIELLQSGQRLMDEAVKMCDAKLFVQSWDAFAQAKEVERMAECLLQWRKQLPPCQEMIRCMRQTFFLSQVVGEEINCKWDLYEQMGNAYYILRDIEQAVWTYKDILIESPPIELKNRILSNLGSTLVDLMRYEEALDTYGELLDSSDVSDVYLAHAHFGFATCARYLGFGDLALKHTKIAEQKYREVSDPRYIHAQHALGVLCLDAKRYDEAKTYFDIALAEYESSNSIAKGDLYEEFVRTEFYKGNYAEANNWCDKCLDFSVGLNQQLVGRIFVWKSWIQELMKNDSASLDALRSAKSLLGVENFDNNLRFIDPNLEISRLRNAQKESVTHNE